MKTSMAATILATGCLLGFAPAHGATPAAGEGGAAPATSTSKLIVGIALPRAQLGQGNSGSTDVAEPVRQALISYLRGPMIEVIPLEARIPIQIAAEAREKSCAFVLYSDIAQKAKGSGSKFLKSMAPLAGALPMVGGMGGSMGTAMAASAVAQGAMQASAMSAQEEAMDNAMAAITGAQQSNVKAGDSLTFDYRLVRTGEAEPVKAAQLQGKAKANGEDVLSPLIEQVAIVVVETVAGG